MDQNLDNKIEIKEKSINFYEKNKKKNLFIFKYYNNFICFI